MVQAPDNLESVDPAAIVLRHSRLVLVASVVRVTTACVVVIDFEIIVFFEELPKVPLLVEHKIAKGV